MRGFLREPIEFEQVKQYIAGQKEPPRKVDFRDELHSWLRKEDIEWDEKHIGDSIIGGRMLPDELGAKISSLMVNGGDKFCAFA